MRVLYDTYWWTSGPISGRVVVREILRAWRDEFPQDEFVLAVRPRDRAAVAAEFPGCRQVRIFGRPHGIATLTQYAFHARRHGVDLAYTQNFAPPGVWSAIFVHDVMYQTNPEWFTRPERAYFWLIPFFARGADLVVTSSQNEARRIRDHNPRLRRVEPVGLAVASALTDADPVMPEVARGLDGFVLTVGRLNVRKNLGIALSGALASGRLTPQRPLVVVGGEDGRSADLPAGTAWAVEQGLIRFVPRVSDAELAWLYTNADLFVCLALDEGFGLPPVEAAHFGTPVVVSDIAVFRENLGDHAIYVDPHDVEAVAEAVRSAPRDRLDVRGLFPTWHNCARNLRESIWKARQNLET
ncbi:glycosyltransferase family 4 protein [Aeromicrobium duanguangcaii]|uniref:Glycosyltransferase family 4 protein n=1 Tax=Aeromicrobium duanguangcaii TaxID=2968086 RepID=A0ABY5KH94_9ACTN|nr:glycosyltransferase family 1 protein [Aeromicrobium duanguangcaii]MCD9155438.1 glycosyltransferase family 4 protein [Aeromicrobium duanguangcaii]UUI69123.1 glycosyltransferase family 4 protein [Aeromicrobium duanguangcaii]